MRKRRKSLVIGVILLVIAIAFVFYAANHPEASFPWSLRTTFIFYGIYIWLLFRFLIVPLFTILINKSPKPSLISAVVALILSALALLIEITSKKVDFYTIVRGFAMIGGVDTGIDNLYHWIKLKHNTHDEQGE